MNGDEVTAQIREDPSVNQTRIVVITAFDSAAPIVRRAIAAGADELICKPTDFKSLLEVIRRIISGAQIRAVA
jgi:DNA-binding NarL/FixJ family response regulator